MKNKMYLLNTYVFGHKWIIIYIMTQLYHMYVILDKGLTVCGTVILVLNECLYIIV